MQSRSILVFLLVTSCLTLSSAFVQDAPAGSSSSKIRQKTEQQAKAPSQASRSMDEGIYRNADFGFAYRTRYGWADRTKYMQDEGSDPGKSQLLLAVFERPPEATSDTVNSAVVIIAESAASYPGLKTAADYMGPLSELTTSKGFKVTQQPYAFRLGFTQLVRSDFAKEMGKLTLYQSSLVILRKGFVVSFSFIGGSEDEVDELIEKLSFGAGRVK